MNKYRPFLKWAGGKYQLLETILPALPEGARLIEPFTGSGVIFLNANFPDYLLAEYNQDLIHIYSALQNEGQDFIEQCAKYFTPKFNKPEQYYRIREKFNNSDNPRERASLLLYLNRHGYNGLCRYNSKGKYNVPFGLYKKPYFPREEMQRFHCKSQQATIVHADFRQTFAMAKAGDVIYCDPPYVPLSQTSDFTSYTNRNFTEEDQIVLAQMALTSAQNGIHVILSNHDTDFTRLHYQAANNYFTFPVRRFISCKAGERRFVNEVLAVFSP